MTYLNVDAGKAAHTAGVLTALGLTGTTIGTPTAMVGTQIIHGEEVDVILRAIEAQKDWGSAK